MQFLLARSDFRPRTHVATFPTRVSAQFVTGADIENASITPGNVKCVATPNAPADKQQTGKYNKTVVKMSEKDLSTYLVLRVPGTVLYRGGGGSPPTTPSSTASLVDILF